MSLTPHEKLAREVRILLNRWVEESDLDLDVIYEIADQAVDGWAEEPVLGFDPDFDPEEDG